MKLIVAVLFASSLLAQASSSAADLVVRRLSNPDAAAADAAMVDLIRGGPSNVPVLQKVLATTKDAACRTRAERALALCVVDAPVANGVKVGLAAERKEVVPGQVVNLTATVCNVTDKPIALFVGLLDNVLEDGTALQQCAADGAVLGQARFCGRAHCGFGLVPIVEVLPPWSSRQFVLRATYRVELDDEFFVRHDGPRLTTTGRFVLPLADAEQGDTVRLRLACTIDPELAKALDPSCNADWKGELCSNAVELRLRAAR